MSNSNFEITNYSVDETTQELVSVEINGKSFGNEPAPTGTNKLYAWKFQSDPSAEGDVFVYTKDENPAVGDFILKAMATGDSSYIDYKSMITGIGENSIVVGVYTYNRYDSMDIVLSL